MSGRKSKFWCYHHLRQEVMFPPMFVCLSVCLFVNRISQNISNRFSETFTEGMLICQRQFIKLYLNFDEKCMDEILTTSEFTCTVYQVLLKSVCTVKYIVQRMLWSQKKCIGLNRLKLFVSLLNYKQFKSAFRLVELLSRDLAPFFRSLENQWNQFNV